MAHLKADSLFTPLRALISHIHFQKWDGIKKESFALQTVVDKCFSALFVISKVHSNSNYQQLELGNEYQRSIKCNCGRHCICAKDFFFICESGQNSDDIWILSKAWISLFDYWMSICPFVHYLPSSFLTELSCSAGHGGGN